MNNYILILGYVAQLASILDNETRKAQANGKPAPKGITAGYLAAREFCKNIEKTNPTISQTAGYSSRVSDIW